MQARPIALVAAAMIFLAAPAAADKPRDTREFMGTYKKGNTNKG